MDHRDHVALLEPANLPPGGTWADLGAGAGAFTLALRQLTGPSARIHAVDRDRLRLAELERAWRRRFEEADNLRLLPADFTRPLDLPLLDGALMANSLHFYEEKEAILRRVGALLKPGGTLLLVEYDSEAGNLWVPHPLSFETCRALLPRAGFGEARLLARHPSGFLGGFYAAAARWEG